jgi:hypothetical protein
VLLLLLLRLLLLQRTIVQNMLLLLQAKELVVHLHKLELRLDPVAVVEAAVQHLLGGLCACWAVILEVHKALQHSTAQHSM